MNGHSDKSSRAERIITITPGRAERNPRAYASMIRCQELGLAIATPVVFISIWEISARVGLLDHRFFPAPSAVVSAGIALFNEHVLLNDIEVSVSRILIGFFFGVAAGLACALALGLSRLTRAALDPFLSALYTVPKLALLPLLLLISALENCRKSSSSRCPFSSLSGFSAWRPSWRSRKSIAKRRDRSGPEGGACSGTSFGPLCFRSSSSPCAFPSARPFS